MSFRIYSASSCQDSATSWIRFFGFDLIMFQSLIDCSTFSSLSSSVCRVSEAAAFICPALQDDGEAVATAPPVFLPPLSFTSHFGNLSGLYPDRGARVAERLKTESILQAQGPAGSPATTSAIPDKVSLSKTANPPTCPRGAALKHSLRLEAREPDERRDLTPGVNGLSQRAKSSTPHLTKKHSGGRASTPPPLLSDYVALFSLSLPSSSSPLQSYYGHSNGVAVRTSKGLIHRLSPS